MVMKRQMRKENEMVWRTQQRCSKFGGSLQRAGRAGSLGLLFLAMTGCAHSPGPVPPPHLTQSDKLSVYGDNLMIEGRKVRDQGIATGDDDMKHRGEAMISQGKILINRANAMIDQPEPLGPVPGISHSAY
jgi:hypothetical protein